MLVVGTPAPSWMPAASYKFEHKTGLTEITVPIKGNYPADFSKQGDYDICPEEGIILFGTLTEVLFAHRIYPALEKNQRYVISGLNIADGSITVVGRVVELLEEEDADSGTAEASEQAPT